MTDMMALGGFIASAGGLLAFLWRRKMRPATAAVLVKRWAAEDNIVIPDPDSVERIVKRIIDGGIGDLQVVADFDRTITAHYVNGRRGASCHGIVESCVSLSAEYRAKTSELFDHYYPLEVTPDLSREEKIPIMKEWYEKNHCALMREDFRKRYILDAVATANVDLREGAREMLGLCKTHDIPLLIFSAGIGNVIKPVIQAKWGELGPNSYIVSNWMVFDPEQHDRCVGFKAPLIHMFNKDESHVVHTPFYDRIKSRPCVVLMGDGLGDVTMADGVPHEAVLKIGFLNAKVDELLEAYKVAFDVVVLHDGDMGVALDTMTAALHKHVHRASHYTS
jgi:5'-nucleotidase